MPEPDVPALADDVGRLSALFAFAEDELFMPERLELVMPELLAELLLPLLLDAPVPELSFVLGAFSVSLSWPEVVGELFAA